MAESNRDYASFFHRVDRLLNKRSQIENRKRCYGLDLELSCTEIHVIDEIGRSPGIGVKGIALNKGVTEGAVSQLVKKLIKKGLVRKQTSEKSEARVSLTLTESGTICFENHIAFHREADKKWFRLLDRLKDEDFKKVQEALSDIEKIMEE